MNLMFKIILKAVYRLLFFITLTTLPIFCFAQIGPTSIPGLLAWFRADSALISTGGRISQVGDLSGNNYNCQQADTLKQPLLIPNILNGRPVMRFDGTDDFLATGNFNSTATQPNTFFVVWSINQLAGAAQVVLSGANNTSTNGIYWNTSNRINLTAGTAVYYSKTAPFNHLITTAVFNASTSVRENGVSKTLNSTNAGSQGINLLHLGCNYGSAGFLRGDIAEVVVYDGTLTTQQRNDVETYLRLRYAPQVNLGPDVVVQDSLCYNLSISSGFSNVAWRNSTGVIGNGNSISVSKAGAYWVTATDAFGYQTSDTINVTFAFSGLNAGSQSICLGDTLKLYPVFSAGGTAGYSYLWNTGNTSDTIPISAQGNYFLQITDFKGCFVRSDTVIVSIDTFSVRNLLPTDSSLCFGSEVGTLASMSEISSINWSNGSSNLTTLVQGSGYLSAVVVNNNGCTAIDSVLVSISGNAPVSDFVFDTVCLGALTSFTNTSYPVPLTDSIVSQSWLFGGGGATSTDINPVYAFSSVGSFQVTLTSTTLAGCASSVNKQVIVRPGIVADFTLADACTNLPLIINEQSISQSPDVVNQWQWNFGNGATSALQSPAYSYNTSGQYTVTLHIQSSFGCRDTLQRTVSVSSSIAPPPPVSLTTPAINFITANNSVSFNWTSAIGAVYYNLEVYSDSLLQAIVLDTLVTVTNVTKSLGYGVFYWRVKSLSGCLDSTSSVTRKLTILNPSSIGNLIFWGEASGSNLGSNGKVAQLNDLSGHNYQAVQTDTAKQPLLVPNVLNGKPVLRFDGTDDYLVTGNFSSSASQPNTVFVVWSVNQPAGAAQVVFSGASSANTNGVYWNTSNRLHITAGTAVYYSKTAPFGHLISTAVFAPSPNASFRENGVSQSLSGSNIGTGALSMLHLGSNYGSAGFLRGDIAEILVFNSTITSQQRNDVEQYLRFKYASQINLGPDVYIPYGFCDTVLKVGSGFKNIQWSTGQTGQQISVNQAGTYWVTAQDIFGYTTTDTVQVFYPYKGMNTSDTVICLGTTISINPILTPSANYSFQWQDGGTQSQILVSQPGSYYCVVTDTNGCDFLADTVLVGVDSFELQNLLQTDTSICSGNKIALNLGGYTAQNIHWSDGSSNSYVVVSTAGDYTVMVEDTNQCIALDTISVDVTWVAPIVNFSANSACFGDSTYFQNQVQTTLPDDVKTWHWNFGGSGTSNAQNPSLVFFAPGDYNVTLSIVTDSGCTGEMTKVVTAALPPVPAFNYPSIVCAGTPVTLTDQTVFLFGDSITNWIWTFNGGDTITSKNAVYEFPAQGSYSVKLTAISKSGCSDTVEQVVDVFPPLTANFDASGLCIGDSTVFTDITSSLSIVSWQWGFGDFSLPSTKQNPKHKYNTPGSYSVTLTVENAIGCVDNISKTVNIVTRPTAKFGQLVTCEDQTYTPLDSSIANNDTISIWKWTIAGTNYTGSSPVHYFSDTGNYSIKLRVSAQSGCSDSTVKVVSVKPRPKAQFSYTPLYGEAPVDVSFVNQSTNSSTYFWSFGDGDVSTDFAPYHTYITNDTFDIQLTAISAFGCEDSTQSTFLVAPTDLDIAVLQVNTLKDKQADGSYLITAGAKVANLGTRIITNAQFYVTIGSGGVISEEWSGLLNPGAVADIVFTAQFVVAAENANSYVCVTAVNVNNSETEISTANNSQCSTTSEGIQLIGPSPNPMSSQAQLGIILPKAGQVVIDIADMAGQYVVQGLQLDLPKGRSNYTLPADKMRAAEYFIRVYHNDEKLVRKFIVAK